MPGAYLVEEVRAARLVPEGQLQAVHDLEHAVSLLQGDHLASVRQLQSAYAEMSSMLCVGLFVGGRVD